MIRISLRHTLRGRLLLAIGVEVLMLTILVSNSLRLQHGAMTNQARLQAEQYEAAMTAYAMQGDREKCLAAGMDAYLAKPARPSEILATLYQLMPDQAARISPADRGDEATAGVEPVPEKVEATSDGLVPIFDRNALLERLGGREEMLRSFLEMFNRNVAGYLDSLLLAVECRRSQAHTIKGVAGNISACRVWKTATAVEVHAREGRLDEAVSLVWQLKDEIEKFQQKVLL